MTKDNLNSKILNKILADIKKTNKLPLHRFKIGHKIFLENLYQEVKKTLTDSTDLKSCSKKLKSLNFKKRRPKHEEIKIDFENVQRALIDQKKRKCKGLKNLKKSSKKLIKTKSITSSPTQQQPHTKKLKKHKKLSQADLKKRREERLAKEETFNSVKIENVNWEILPFGTDWATFEINFTEQITKSGGNFEQKVIDEAKERFKRIFELRPKSIFRGFETFSDYFALLFEDTDKVVLESVNYGNAIYIIKGDWKILSRKTKAELKKRNSTEVIQHRRDWFSKLKTYLQIGFE